MDRSNYPCLDVYFLRLLLEYIGIWWATRTSVWFF